ncbi:MAG: helix-turn-helix domain-containing protein [Halobacteriota archaeon]
MTQARLVVKMPDTLWIGEISREYPDSTFRILTAVPSEHAGYALVSITSQDLEEILPRIEAHAAVTEISIIQRTATEVTIQFETTMPLIMLSAKESGIAIEFPVEVVDGHATIDVTGSHERLSELGTQLRNFGLEFDIEYIQERLHTSQLLTETQQELLALAVENGYYDTPRTCTLTELAEECGNAKSTCSETLHRAEEIIVKEFVDGLSPPPALETRITEGTVE